jgi:Ca-activated chloride channel homolog
MTATNDSPAPALTLSTLWERADVARGGDETALVLRIQALSTPSPSSGRAPIDVAFALDRSGSMNGPNKIDLVKEAVIAATHHLGNDDRVALVVFDGFVDVLHELTPADGAGKRRVARVLRGVHARGSTNLSGGWLTACQQLASDETANAAPRLQRSLLLTDGLANQGITDPDELMTHASELRKRGIDTTTIGVGRHFDELLLSGMAEAGGGAFQYIADTARLQPFFEREIGEMMDMVAVGPVLRITFPDRVHGHLVNAFPVRRRGKTVTVDLRNLSSGETVELVFDVTVHDGAGEDDLAPMVELEWRDPRTGDRSGMHEELPGLRLVDADVARTASRDDKAAEIVATARSDRDQREAVRLDREGRFRESRAYFRQSAEHFASAPATADMQMAHGKVMAMAEAPERPLDEHDRKRVVSEAHARSRGRRRDDS